MSDQPNTDNGVAETNPGLSLKSKITVGIILVVISLIAIDALLRHIQVSREVTSTPSSRCINNCKIFAIALHNYHDDYGVFPPAYTIDAKGNRLHSWRTLLLPYMEQTALYEQIDLSKPWDDPANAKVKEQGSFPSYYYCYSSNIPENQTLYQVVSSPTGLFYQSESRSLSDVTDNQGETLAVIEVPEEHAVHWMSPHDVSEENFLKYTKQNRLVHDEEIRAVTVEGAARAIPIDTPTTKRKAMISIAGADDSTIAW